MNKMGKDLDLRMNIDNLQQQINAVPRTEIGNATV
jgi:hypothetical protein